MHIKSEKALWRIMLEVQNEEVYMKAVELLNKLYTKLSEPMQEYISEISNNFIEVAIEKLNIFCDNMKSKEMNKTKEIVKLLKLINDMIEESELKVGSSELVPMETLINGKELDIDICVVPNFMHSNFSIRVHSKMTLYRLKVEIANKIKIHPENIVINSQIGKDVGDRSNGKTIEQLEIGKFLQVSIKSPGTIPKGILKTPNSNFTEKGVKVFTEIFEKFSKGNKVMSKSQFQDVLKICLSMNKVNPRANKEFDIIDFHDNYIIALKDFIKYFEDILQNDENIIWENLILLGYNSKLEHYKSSTHNKDESYKKLPRYILSSNPDYFDFLFKLFGKY